MNCLIGREAYDFTAKAVMEDNKIKNDFNLKRYIDGMKAVLFFYPLDFTFVCPSEIIAINNRISSFIEKNTKVIAISVDSHFSHLVWKTIPTNKGGIGNIQIPMVSDLSKKIATEYGVLNEDGISFRGTFLIDQNFIIRHLVINDLPLGRNVDEALRMIDALSFHEQHGEVCPAGWKQGEEGMKPTAEGVSDYLSSNADKL